MQTTKRKPRYVTTQRVPLLLVAVLYRDASRRR